MMSPKPEDTPTEPTETLVTEVHARLHLLEAARPKSLDGFAISSKSKLPFKARGIREALLWRTVQLGESAFESFRRDKLASAILLTRATVETCAALWYLRVRLETTVQSTTAGKIDEDLMRLLMGSKADADILPPPINVLSFVDRVEKDIPGFRCQYDRLSEFAHPNWAGTTLLFSKMESGGVANFGENIRGTESTMRIGLANLSVALAMFEVSYNHITDLMPGFVQVCERQTGPDSQGGEHSIER
jgi:hypothetical protein